jgi:hypothetical protein
MSQIDDFLSGKSPESSPQSIDDFLGGKPKKKKESGASFSDYAGAANSAIGQGVANLGAAAGTFIQAPAANTLSGILGAKALADRGLTWLINQAEPGSAVPHEQTQEDAQLASQFAAESRAENANTPWNLPARAGRYLEQDSRRVVAENQANDRATNPELMRQQQAMGDAEGFVGNLKASFQNPLALTHTLVKSAPDMALGVGVGSVLARARMAGAVAAGEAAAANAAKAGANEAAQAAAAKAAIDAVESKAIASASTAGTLSEAGSSAMQAREGTYQEVASMPLETLAKSPRFQQIMAQNGGDAAKARETLANELADQATMLSGAGTMAGSALTNKLFGGDATAKSIVGGRMSVKELGKRIGQDTVEEGLQGVPEDAAQHGATVQADPSKKYDPAGSLAQNMVAGFAMGSGGHGLAYTKEAVASMGKGGQTPPAPGTPAAPAQNTVPTAPTAAPVDTEAEKALRTPTSMTALDRAHEITPELTAARERLADLTPENGYGPPFDQERQELASRADSLQAELDGITKTWPKTEYGAKTNFSTEAGARIDGVYALMDANDLVTSHDENLRANPLYPQEMQPRDRSRSASEMQVSGIVQKLDPARLGLSADAATGAPIVGEDGLVESGNARTIAMKRMYSVNDGRWPHSQQDVPELDNGKSSPARRYRKFLEDSASQFGLTAEAVDAMEKPVLVRVRTTPVNRAEFARQANASTVAAMSPSEQAKSDASRIDAMDDLAPDDAGDFSGPASRPFIRRFMARLPGTEQAGMIDADGNLSTTGYTRVRNAILAKAYGDSPVLMRMVESLDDNLRNITKALISAAPKVAQMRDAIAKGARFDSDITPDLMAAVEELSHLKDAGTSISDALAQAGMFGDKYSPETRDLLQFLADNIRRPRRMADFIVAYMDALDSAGNPAQGSMFGDAQAPARQDLIKAAKSTIGENTDATAQDTQRGIAGENTKPGEKAGSKPADAPGSGRSDQGDGATGPAAGQEQGTQEQGRAEAVTQKAEAAEPKPLQEDGVPEKTPEKKPITRTADRDFWAYAKEQGHAPGDVKVGSELHTRLKAEFDALKAGKARLKEITGKKINEDWSAFSAKSDTMGVPRADMPQIKAEHRGALTQFLAARGVAHEADADVSAMELKPTQAEFSPGKVKQAQDFEGGDRSILVSADGFVLDGHHQWLAKLSQGLPIRVIRFDAPMADLLPLAREFPSAEVSREAEAVEGKQQDGLKSPTPDEIRQLVTQQERAEKERQRKDQEAGDAGSTDFVQAPGGNLDFGEITPEMSKAMRRQAGKIRLRKGNEAWGLIHIEARHGEQFKSLGFQSANGFIAHVASSFNAIYKGKGAGLSIVLETERTGGRLMVQLEASSDGDFYDVKTASPIRAGQYKNEKPLWQRDGTITQTAQGSSLLPRDQSGNQSVPQGNDVEQGAEKAKSPSKTSTKIEDSGEVLEGARKLYAKSYAAKLDEGKGMDLASVPLSKSWPEPDYQRLIDEGIDPWAVALARAVRDEVPNKPMKGWKLKGWVQKVEFARDMAAKVMSGEITKDQFMAEGGKHNLADWFNKIDLYEAVGHANSLKTLRFSEGEYSFYGGQKFSPAKKLWTINAPSTSASATWSNGNWGNDLVVADTKAEAIEKYKAWAAEQTGKDQAKPASKRTEFDVYSYRNKPAVFIVGKRISATKSIDLMEFETSKEANAFIAANQDQLEKMLAEAKVEQPERRESNTPRVGADHRNGADVTTEQFREAFGFRGEQFGASMPQAERQANMNQAYDALMDLAGVIGIPPKALSLNGELGLAFGARGRGGKNPAMAHYEPDTTGSVTPNRVVINLTRKNGAGSLAHEWFHAVDNYFARMRGEKAGMLTESYPAKREGVRPEMVEAFKKVMMAIQSTGVRERSKNMDKKRTKDYWSTGLEMAARSFESYIIAKLQDKSGSNDYLANIVPESLWLQQESYPYPTMGELPAIRTAFDNFFATVQTKETDSGVALFSRANAGDFENVEHLTKEALDALVNRIKAMMPNMPTVHVLADPSKAPPALREYIIRQDAWDDVEGAMHKGELYMFASGLSDELRAEHVLAEHEAAHFGLRAVLGSSLKTAMHLVYAQNASVLRAVTELQKRGKLSNAEATEEVIVDIPTADLAKLKGWRKVVMMVRDWMQAHGYDKIAQKITDMLDGSLSQQQRADLFVAELVRGARDYVAGKLPSRRVGYIGDTRLSTTLQEDIKRQEAWLQREASARGFADIEDMLAKNYPLFEKLAELWRKKNPASDGVMLSRSPDTKTDFETRIDALFAGEKAETGTKVLDSSDMMGLLGYPQVPLVLNERHLMDGMTTHPELTAKAWKRVPGWIENPAAAYLSMGQANQNRVVLLAPELLAGHPVVMVIEPNPGVVGGRAGQASSEQLLVTVFAKTNGAVPLASAAKQGKLLYLQKEMAPAISSSGGVQFPKHGDITTGRKKILTEKNLAGFIKARQQGEANVTGQKESPTKNATEAIQTVLLNVQNDGGDARIVYPNDQSGQDEPIRLSRAPAKAQGLSVQERADEIIQEKAKAGGSVLDAAAHALTRVTRLEKITSWAYDFAAQQLDRFTPDAIKAGVVSDYGVPESVIDQRAVMQGRKMQHLRKVGGLLDKLNTLTRSESRVAYAWMNEADASAADSLMQDLPAESVKVLQEVQKMIDHLSREAVSLGQLSEQAYKAHRFAYLRRSYAKHVVELSPKENAKRGRTISVLGDQYKGRGFEEGASMRQIQAAAPDWWKRKMQEGKADTAVKGEKFIRLERRAPSGEGVTPLDGMDGKQPGRVLEVNYWPAAEPMPAKYQDWAQAGTFEARDTQGDKVVMWRDYTKDEREKMGEVDEARFAIAKTLHGMIHDVEVGRYLRWIAQTQAKLVAADVPGKLVTAEEGWGHVFKPGEWVQVPDTKITGTDVAKYGKLAGRFVPGPVWNDVRQVGNSSFGKVPWAAFNTLQSWWKTSKTALSPGVHMNNIMSDFVMADWHDVSQAHVRKALRILMAASNRDNKGMLGTAMNAASKMGIDDREAAQLIVNRYKDSGGELGSWATVEMQNDQLEPILKDLQKELGIEDELGNQLGAFNAVQQFMHAKFPSVYNAAGGLMGSTLGRVAAKAAGKVVGGVVQEGKTLIDLYQSEDEVFRLAAWLKSKEAGMDDMAAGKVSRKSFLDYSVNAPWIVAMKNSAWPFMAFSYRAIPMFLETAGKKPHKLLKLMAVAGALNAMGAMLAGGDDDEDELRKLLPEEKAGRIWGMVPKLIRMPWNDAHGSPVFLDVRRFVPVGDVFDVDQGHSAIPLPPALQPGGIIGMLSELRLNKSAFTGKPITLETDTTAEQSGKVLDYMYKWMMPNVLGVPGSYATTGVQNAYRGKEDPFGREQSIAQAVSSAFGLKLGSYPTDVLRQNLVKKTKAESSEIDHNITKLSHQYQQNGISREEFDEGVKYQLAKKTKLWEEMGEKMR